jgi:uncharacterized protein
MKSNETCSKRNSAQEKMNQPIVISQGEATVKKTPDQAFLSIATETRDAQAYRARQRNAEDMTAVQATIKNVGLPADTIRTTSYSLTPDIEWKNGRGIAKGYIVHNQIEIRIDNIDNLSDVIDAVNATRNITLTISGLRYALKNQQAAENEALQLAVKTALVRAQAIVASAQRSLGAIVRIEEQYLGGIHRQEPFLMRTAMAKSNDSAETPITIGDIEVQARVTLTAELR